MIYATSPPFHHKIHNTLLHFFIIRCRWLSFCYLCPAVWSLLWQDFTHLTPWFSQAEVSPSRFGQNSKTWRSKRCGKNMSGFFRCLVNLSWYWRKAWWEPEYSVSDVNLKKSTEWRIWVMWQNPVLFLRLASGVKQILNQSCMYWQTIPEYKVMLQYTCVVSIIICDNYDKKKCFVAVK